MLVLVRILPFWPRVVKYRANDTFTPTLWIGEAVAVRPPTNPVPSFRPPPPLFWNPSSPSHPPVPTWPFCDLPSIRIPDTSLPTPSFPSLLPAPLICFSSPSCPACLYPWATIFLSQHCVFKVPCSGSCLAYTSATCPHRGNFRTTQGPVAENIFLLFLLSSVTPCLLQARVICLHAFLQSRHWFLLSSKKTLALPTDSPVPSHFGLWYPDGCLTFPLLFCSNTSFFRILLCEFLSLRFLMIWTNKLK